MPCNNTLPSVKEEHRAWMTKWKDPSDVERVFPQEIGGIQRRIKQKPIPLIVQPFRSMMKSTEKEMPSYGFMVRSQLYLVLAQVKRKEL